MGTLSDIVVTIALVWLLLSVTAVAFLVMNAIATKVRAHREAARQRAAQEGMLCTLLAHLEAQGIRVQGPGRDDPAPSRKGQLWYVGGQSGGGKKDD